MKFFLKIMLRNIWLTVKWAWASWFFAFPIAFFSAPFLLSHLFANISDFFRIVGAIYQILGILIAVYGIMERLFGLNKSDFWALVKAYLRAFPLFKWKKIVGIGSVITAKAKVSANLTTKVIPKDDSLGERVKVLEHALQTVQESVDQFKREYKDSISELNIKLESEAETSKNKFKEQEDLLKKVFLKDVKFEILGVLMILIGVTYATIPEFILWVFT